MGSHFWKAVWIRLSFPMSAMKLRNPSFLEDHAGFLYPILSHPSSLRMFPFIFGNGLVARVINALNSLFSIHSRSINRVFGNRGFILLLLLYTGREILFRFFSTFFRNLFSGSVIECMSLRISDRRKINGKLAEVRKIIASALDEGGYKECSVCHLVLASGNFYTRCAECKSCRIQRSLKRYRENKSKEQPC